MHCPKCHAALPNAAVECPACGIIVAKYRKREEVVARAVQDAALGSRGATDAPSQPRSRAASRRDFAATTSMAAAVGRGILLLLLSLWTTTLVGDVNAERVSSSFIHLPNLVFHEAGHVLFSPFGHFMSVLGGSLMQVLVPLVCAGAFLWQARDPFGAAVAAWWAGENLIDVAPYINDARELKLVLLGGKTGAEVEGHDWEFLLNAMGAAHHDHTIAAVVHAIGILTMTAALVWGAIVVLNQSGMLRRGRQTTL